MTHESAPADLGALWLVTLQRAIGRATHDVKDAMNGVSVNLEVVRSRAARPDVPASAVATFAESAGHQFERLTILVEAVLALSRAERAPADVGVVLRRTATLCSASTSASDAAVLVREEQPDRSLVTTVCGDAVRLSLMAPLLDVVAGTDRARKNADVTCTVAGNEVDIEVAIASDDRRPVMPVAISDLVRAAGVRWTEGDHALLLAFPRA